ncbi:energy transducer TonB [Flavobacterium hauense]
MKNLLLLLFSITAFAQSEIIYKGERINALDAANMKTGIWKAYDETKDLLITCVYENDKPVTETRYYKNTKLIAVYDNVESFTIYHRKDIIKAKLLEKENKTTVLTDTEGKELDKNIQDFFYQNCQIKPMYYGGEKLFLHYLDTSINENIAKKTNGKMIISFKIDNNGNFGGAEVKEGLTPDLDTNAISVIKKMARWQPGHLYGKFVGTGYNIPIKINTNNK